VYVVLAGVTDGDDDTQKTDGQEEDDLESEAAPLFKAMQIVETVNKNGGTPLHVAAVFDSRKCIQVLIDLDVDVSIYFEC
jgi:hypothetical protein